jgi:hypothetical protein
MDNKEPQKDTKYVTDKHGLSIGIITMGIFALFFPWGAQAVADLVGADRFAVLSGIVYVLGVVIILAGIGVLRMFSKEE